ncbi:MAG: HAD family hydrolase [Ferruginibacter sp.]
MEKLSTVKAFKNIIFDLGGVLLDIDYQATSTAFTQLGVAEFDALFSQFKSNDLFEKLETGTISDADFYATLQAYCKPGTTIQEMENAWNAMLGTFRMDSLNKLVALSKQYPVYLLSNTNAIHLRAFQQSFTAQTGIKDLNVYFEKAYYSHLIGKRKPYAATYRAVLADAGLQASETLFIDDSENNILGAQEAGLQTHLLLSTERLETLQW